MFVGGIVTITSMWFASPTIKIEPVEIVYKLGDTIPVEFIKIEIAKHATGTKAYQMLRTIECETPGYKNVQSNITHDNVQEDSWGLSQINLYWNPKVSKEQALDPKFAIKWMADNWSSSKWYGYDRDKNTCNKIYK